MRKAFIIFLTFIGGSIHAQNIPPDRLSDWSQSGAVDSFQFIRTSIYFEDFADFSAPDAPQDSALSRAINFLGDVPVRIIFPEGEFYFEKSIKLRSNLIIEGAGSKKTILKLDPKDTQNGIEANGRLTDTLYPIRRNISKGDLDLRIPNNHVLKPGDWVKISFNDSSLVTSSWALGAVGQLVQIQSVIGNQVHFKTPIRLDIPLSLNPTLRLIDPIQNLKFTSVGLEMRNESWTEGTNFRLSLAVNCIIKEIESINGNFTHLLLHQSANISVECSYFHRAFRYGNGGEGYGIT
ncbi:MAG: hypothetical protein KDC24_11115, partial [Saprospiraceae bacterium]|nr:hypothetical protein [Saprospiraceae bacterium]